MTTPFLVAQHEARHGVCAWLMGFEVTSMTLSARGLRGNCCWRAPTTADIHAVLLVSLAGLAGDAPEHRSSSDLRVASAKYTAWCRQHGPQPPFESRIAQWLADCRMLLLSEHARIRTLAKALLAHGTLNASDVHDLLSHHDPGRPQGGHTRHAVVPPASTGRRRQPERGMSLDVQVQLAQPWLERVLCASRLRDRGAL